MKQVYFKEIGNDRRLELRNVGIPIPEGSEVLVKNKLIGFNPVDYKIFEGGNLLSAKISDKLPWTPGYDVVGVVDKIGSRVTDYKVGDRVCGMIGFPLRGGAYQEYSICYQDELAIIPTEVNDQTAIYSCLSGLTALQAFNFSNSKSHFVLGSTGSVGLSLIEILKQTKCRNYFSYRSQAALEFLEEYDNALPINLKESYRLEDKFTLIDLVGGETALNFIKKNKSNIEAVISVPTYSATEVQAKCEKSSIQFNHFVVKPNVEDTKKILSIFKEYKTNLPAKIFYLEQVEQLFDFYLKQSNIGKIVIDTRH